MSIKSTYSGSNNSCGGNKALINRFKVSRPCYRKVAFKYWAYVHIWPTFENNSFSRKERSSGRRFYLCMIRGCEGYYNVRRECLKLHMVRNHNKNISADKIQTGCPAWWQYSAFDINYDAFLHRNQISPQALCDLKVSPTIKPVPPESRGNYRMDVTSESTSELKKEAEDGEWGRPHEPAEAEGPAWSPPKKPAGNPWESVEPSAPTDKGNTWASNTPNRKMERTPMLNDLNTKPDQTQIKRIVLRSAINSIDREVSILQKNEDEDAIILKLATAEEYRHYLCKHLKSFVLQHAPEDAQEKKYFFCGSRVSSDQLTGNANAMTRKRRRSYAGQGSSYLFGSWDRSLYTNPIVTCLRKFYEDSELSSSGKLFQMKLRIQLGKMFYFGADFTAPDTWNVSLAEMEVMTSEQTLRPCFSSYCHVDAVMRARKVLHASGYEQHKLESSQDTVCAELVDMDAPTKPSFNIRFMLREKTAAKINKKSRRHAYVTFVDHMQRHDLQLRIQSRQEEPILDEQTRRLVYKAWTKRTGIEDPLISPSGHRYFPLRVLHKVFEYYKKGETEVVLIQMSPVVESINLQKELEEENADIRSRWQIYLQQSFTPPRMQNVNSEVEHTLTRVTELVAEAKRFSDAISYI